MPGIGGKSDGKQCIIGGEAHSGVLGKTSFYLWEPDTNETNFLVDIPNLCTGYWGARTSYYMQEGRCDIPAELCRRKQSSGL